MSLLRLRPLDDLDTRREVYHLLTKLTPEQRVDFLNWACDRANERIKIRRNPPWVLVTVSSSTGTVEETFYDLMHAVMDFDLPINAVLAELERRAVEARKLWLPTA